jgi:hypothetical protein
MSASSAETRPDHNGVSRGQPGVKVGSKWGQPTPPDLANLVPNWIAAARAARPPLVPRVIHRTVLTFLLALEVPPRRRVLRHFRVMLA